MRATKLATIAVALVAVMAPIGPAFAARESGEPPPKDRTYTNPPRVADVEEPSPTSPVADPVERPATLPFTGAGLVGFVVAGSLAIGGGVALLRRARSRDGDL